MNNKIINKKITPVGVFKRKTILIGVIKIFNKTIVRIIKLNSNRSKIMNKTRDIKTIAIKTNRTKIIIEIGIKITIKTTIREITTIKETIHKTMRVIGVALILTIETIIVEMIDIIIEIIIKEEGITRISIGGIIKITKTNQKVRITNKNKHGNKTIRIITIDKAAGIRIRQIIKIQITKTNG